MSELPANPLMDGHVPKYIEQSTQTPELLSRRPMFPVHDTTNSMAANALVHGIVSAAEADRQGKVSVETGGRMQSEHAISITDPERFFTHELNELYPPEWVTSHAYGVDSPHRGAYPIAFFHKGGISLLLSPDIVRWAGTVPREKANLRLVNTGLHTGDMVQYGGGFSGEAVVDSYIAPSDIHGVVFTGNHQAYGLVDHAKTALGTFVPESTQSFFRMTYQEILLMDTFGTLSREDWSHIRRLKEIEDKMIQIHTKVNEDHTIFRAVDPRDMSPFAAKLRMEEATFRDQVYILQTHTDRVDATKRLTEYIRKTIPMLCEQYQVTTVEDVLIRLATIAKIPMYDRYGIPMSL